MEKRIKYIDIVKGIGILLVINSHLPNGSSLVTRGVSFNVAAFFAATGALCQIKSNKKQVTIYSNVKRKASALLWPYFSLSLVYITFYGVVNLVSKQDPLAKFLARIFDTITFLGIGTLWFLPVLFIAQIIFELLIKVKKGNIFLFFILIFGPVLCQIATVYGVNSLEMLHNPVNAIITVFLESILGIGYIWLGFHITKIIETRKINDNLYLVIAAVSLGINWFVGPYLESDFHLARIGNFIIFILASFSGIVGCFCISVIFQKIKYISDFFTWVGRNSIIIMGTHLEYKIVNIAYIASISILRNASQGIKSIFMFLIIILVEWLIVTIVNKTRLRYIFYAPKK